MKKTTVLKDVRIWYTILATDAHENVREFCIVLTPQDALDWLNSHITTGEPDWNATCPVCWQPESEQDNFRS